MWNVQGAMIDPTWFMPFVPLRVLNDYDGPRIFTLNDSKGGLCLACWSVENTTHSRYLIVPTTTKIVSDMERGLLSVREAMTQATLWVADVRADGVVEFAYLTSIAELPEDTQPQSGVYLHRKKDLHRKSLIVPDLEYTAKQSSNIHHAN